jgi:uncharacterized membrane-anchored protein
MRFCLAYWISILLLPLSAAAQTPEKSPIDWQRGPVTAKIGDQANIKVPEGMLFADAAGAKTFLQLTQNIPNGDELGVLASADNKWFVIFRFLDVGYVKDDEKSSLDADAMMKSIRQGTEEANAERKSRGWETMEIVGWVRPPHYDEATHNLEWSFEGKSERGGPFVNQNTRYLGRRGYMSVELVLDPKDSAAVIPEYRTTLAGFAYNSDSNYRAFVRGDKVAEYGLTALVIGGAAAVATKTGLLKGLGKLLLASWKLVAIGLVGIGSFLKKLFAGRRPAGEVPPQPAE